MNELLMLAAVPGAIWLFLMFLRMPGVVFTLSILVGKLFAEGLSGPLHDFADNFITLPDLHQTQLFLLLLPVALSVILTKSQIGTSKVMINSLLLLLASMTLLLFALPYTDFQSKLSPDSQDIVNSYQNYIVAATGAMALLFAWTPHFKLGKHKKK